MDRYSRSVSCLQPIEKPARKLQKKKSPSYVELRQSVPILPSAFRPYSQLASDPTIPQTVHQPNVHNIYSAPLLVPWLFSPSVQPLGNLIYLPADRFLENVEIARTSKTLEQLSADDPIVNRLQTDVKNLIPLPVVEASEELNASGHTFEVIQKFMDFEPLTPDLSPRILSPSKSTYKKRVKPPKLQRKKSAHNFLWQFLLELLSNPKYNPLLIQWVDMKEGVFKMNDTKSISQLWGSCKNRPSMNYETMGRALRYYYTKGILKRIPKKRLVYQFTRLPSISTSKN